MGTSSMANAQLEAVPDWIKNTAGWWSEGKVSTPEFLDGIEFLINQGIILVPGYVQVADAQSVDQESLDEIWTTIDSLQNQIDSVGSEDKESQPLGFYTVKKTESLPGPLMHMLIQCDSGDIATGGGFDTASSHKIKSSVPINENNVRMHDGEVATGWMVIAEGKGQFDGYLSCADYSPNHKVEFQNKMQGMK